jgi:hypothetical protein
MLMLVSGAALADEKQQCVDAYKQAQMLRKSGDYVTAREQLLICSKESCPAIVKQDCVPWLGEITRGIASVVVEATDASGKTLSTAKVSVDGKVVATTLDGRPIDVSPGTHAIRIEAEGAPAVERSVVLKEGEKNRAVKVELDVVAPKPSGTEPQAQTSRPVPAGAIVVGAVGLVGVGVFATLGLLGTAKKSDMDACKPNCNPADVSTVRTQFIAADVALAVGGVALASAIVWILLRPEVKESAPSTTVGAALLPGGSFLSLTHRF